MPIDPIHLISKSLLSYSFCLSIWRNLLNFSCCSPTDLQHVPYFGTTGNIKSCDFFMRFFLLQINKLTFPRVFAESSPAYGCMCMGVCKCACVYPVARVLHAYPYYIPPLLRRRPCNRSSNQFVHSLWFFLSQSSQRLSFFLVCHNFSSFFWFSIVADVAIVAVSIAGLLNYWFQWIYCSIQLCTGDHIRYFIATSDFCICSNRINLHL